MHSIIYSVVIILFVLNRYGISQVINWYVKAGDTKLRVRTKYICLILVKKYWKLIVDVIGNTKMIQQRVLF